MRYRNAGGARLRRRRRLGDGRRLTGTVSPVFGERLVSVTYSKLGRQASARSRGFRCWPCTLTIRAGLVGGLHRSAEARHHAAGARVSGGPRARRSNCCGTWSRSTTPGRREPLPLPIKTSYAWACARHMGDDPETGGVVPVESRATIPARTRTRHRCAPGGRMRGCRSLMQPLRPGEEYDGETNRLGAYAARLWLPMLRAERGRTDGTFRPAGPVARRELHHRAGGQRGHWQDVRAGRIGHALRRRGCGDAGPDAAHHVRPRRQPGAARTGARARSPTPQPRSTTRR